MGRETCHIFLNLGVFLIAILLPAKTLALFRPIIDIIRDCFFQGKKIGPVNTFTSKFYHRHKGCQRRFPVHLPWQQDCHPQQASKYSNKNIFFKVSNLVQYILLCRSSRPRLQGVYHRQKGFSGQKHTS